MRAMADLFSEDPISRRDALREILRRRAYEKCIPQAQLGRVTNHTQQRWDKLMREGERSCPALADLGPILNELGVEVVDAWLEQLGYRAAQLPSPMEAPDVIATCSKLMQETGEAIAEIAVSARDGVITTAELSGADGQLEDVIRAALAAKAALRAAALRAGARR
jgi:nucleoside 2-deoxyribosyltransferase